MLKKKKKEKKKTPRAPFAPAESVVAVLTKWNTKDHAAKLHTNCAITHKKNSPEREAAR